ncbi:MAG: PHP domain-containing protein [Candidatus Ozemobacteraceae bacterium]
MACRKQNLHNHTRHSDGRFPVDDLLDAAVSAGLEGIGISDHFFTSKVFRGHARDVWMKTVWPRYLADIARAKMESLQRRPGLKVWRGIEIDTCFARVGLEIHALPWSEINTLDYVLLEYVGEEESGGMSTAKLPLLRTFCNVPIILAHPHIERLERAFPLENFFEILRMNSIALELPAGSRNKWFWGRRDVSPLRRVPVTIGVDLHDDLSEVGALSSTLEFIDKNDLGKQLADPDSLKSPAQVFSKNDNCVKASII